MYEVIFLWALALLYIIFAVIQDFKTREIANWLTFSLVIFALGFRFFYSLFQNDGFVFFYNGLIGLGIFFVIGNLLYYGKVFAGGDAKLMIALGAVFPYFTAFSSNLQLFFDFILIFLFVSFFYIFVTSGILCIKHFKPFKKEFVRQLKKSKKLMIIILSFSVIFLALGFIETLFFIVGILIFFTSYLYIYSKAIDESCMVKRIKVKDLREGDWLYSNLKLGRKEIKAKWEGLTKREIREIAKKFKEVKIRQGIPFSPVFLIGFIILIILNMLNLKLWNSFW
jgi:Flp pilus assembly protein protease CpaA